MTDKSPKTMDKSSTPPASAEGSETVSEDQLPLMELTCLAVADESGINADEPISNSANDDDNAGREEAELAESSVGDKIEAFSHQKVSLQEEVKAASAADHLQNPSDTKNEREEVTQTKETNCTEEQHFVQEYISYDENFNEKSTSEVAEVLEKIVNEVDISYNLNESNFSTEDTAFKNQSVHEKEVLTANDIPTKSIPHKDDTTPILDREILFTDPGWSRRWAAIPDKNLTFVAPVLRVEPGRFLWSSETYNKRILAIYKQPHLILILRLPVNVDEVKRLRGSQASSHRSSLVAESVVDSKISKIRLSQLSHPMSLPLNKNRSGGLQSTRKRTCFDILTPTEVIELSAAFLPDESFDNIEYASDKCLSDTYRFEHAISESIVMAHMNSHNNTSNKQALKHGQQWKHQIILGSPHSYVIGGNDQALKEALASALELQKVGGGGGNNNLDSNIIDERDMSGNTALHYACRNRRSLTVSILVGAGANCSIPTQDLKTPCHICAESLDSASLSIILSAQKFRPDPNALDSNLRTPMCVAVLEGKMVDGIGNANALDQCLSALEAWGGQLTLGGSAAELHPIHLAQWKSAELGVILSHCHYHYPLLSGPAGISVSALYQYPIHLTLIHLREQIYLALTSSNANVTIIPESVIVSRLQTLLIHGFEPNERMEGIWGCAENESKRLTGYFGFTPLQILIAAAKEVMVIDSINQRRNDVQFLCFVKSIIELIQSCAKTLLEKGARINLPPPPITRLDRDTPPGCYSLIDSMSESNDSKVPPLMRDELKLDNGQILTLLGGADRLKAPQALFASLPKSVESVGTLQFITSPSESDAPGGSDDSSCAVCWSEFGVFTNRKHLCRASGRWVCNECSTKRISENGIEQRVTDGLYNLATMEQEAVNGTLKTQVSSCATSRLKSESNYRQRTSTSDWNRSFLGLKSSSKSSASQKEERNLSTAERITSAISGLGQAKDAVIERGAKLEGLAEKTEKLNNASVDFMNMAKELERQQNSWW